RFKQVSYLFTILAGAGFQVWKTNASVFAVDAAAGGTVEEDFRPPAQGDGAYHFGEAFSYKLSKTATVTENATALFKMKNSADSPSSGSRAPRSRAAARTRAACPWRRARRRARSRER